MSGLTPERIRDAVEVLREVFVIGDLREEAARREREQAAEAKREKRVEALAREVHQMAWPTDDYAGTLAPKAWPRIARGLLERYPALLEGA